MVTSPPAVDCEFANQATIARLTELVSELTVLCKRCQTLQAEIPELVKSESGDCIDIDMRPRCCVLPIIMQLRLLIADKLQ